MCITVHEPGSSNKIVVRRLAVRLWRLASACLWGRHHVESILVLCRGRQAARPLSRGGFPRLPSRMAPSAADTLVWTEGMASWQKAGEIPGLMSGMSGGSSPLAAPQEGMPPARGGGCRWRSDLGRFRDLGFHLAQPGLDHQLHVRHPAALGGADVLPVDPVLHPRSAAAQSWVHRQRCGADVGLCRRAALHRRGMDRVPAPQPGLQCGAAGASIGLPSDGSWRT